MGRERSTISQFYEAGLIQEIFIKTMKAAQGGTRSQRGEQGESTQGESRKIKGEVQGTPRLTGDDTCSVINEK